MENKIDGESFGAKIKALREAKEWKVTDLARKCGNISPGRIKQIENGIYTPKFKTILLMAEAFDVDPFYLISNCSEKQIHEETMDAIGKITNPLLKEVFLRAWESATFKNPDDPRLEVAKHRFALDVIRGIQPLANQKAIEQVVHTIKEMDPQTSEKMDKLVEIMGGKMRQ